MDLGRSSLNQGGMIVNKLAASCTLVLVIHFENNEYFGNAHLQNFIRFFEYDSRMCITQMRY